MCYYSSRDVCYFAGSLLMLPIISEWVVSVDHVLVTW
jgi:hypothetical protein